MAVSTAASAAGTRRQPSDDVVPAGSAVRLGEQSGMAAQNAAMTCGCLLISPVALPELITAAKIYPDKIL